SFPFSIFFSTPPATTEISTLSLHDALPISGRHVAASIIKVIMAGQRMRQPARGRNGSYTALLAAEADIHPSMAMCKLRPGGAIRSEEHTSELQSRSDLVCRLLLEKKKKKKK